MKLFLILWYTLAVLLPDLAGLAFRDWRAAVAGACVGVAMIALSVRLTGTPIGAQRLSLAA